MPLLTILALLSKRHQFPFIIAFIAAGVIFSLFIGDGHDVRLAELSKQQQAALKPVAFAAALKDWKAASGWNAKGCEQLPAGAPSLPAARVRSSSPARAVGAGPPSSWRVCSACLKMTASTRGKIQTARAFHQQLFAISGVSGSSVGAAFFR